MTISWMLDNVDEGLGKHLTSRTYDMSLGPQAPAFREALHPQVAQPYLWV
jgi:hypothetical protein